MSDIVLFHFICMCINKKNCISYCDYHLFVDVTYNDCSIPEESWSKEEEVSSVYTAYVPGSLVWAKVRGYPWWPGMVVQDPEIDKFFQLDGFSELPVSVCVFFS